jgi:phospholipid N-methyltransferase
MSIAMQLDQRARFLRSFLANPARVGAIMPTSRPTVRAMLDLADVGGARVVAELGAGTGVFTRELLARLPADARLLAFEIDPALAAGLQRRFDDPRLTIVADTAERLGAQLEGATLDVVVSVLPLTSMPAAVRDRIFAEVAATLAADGTFLQIQYSTLRERELKTRFGSVTRRLSPVNVPPAFVYACREPRKAGAITC